MPEPGANEYLTCLVKYMRVLVSGFNGPNAAAEPKRQTYDTGKRRLNG